MSTPTVCVTEIATEFTRLRVMGTAGSENSSPMFPHCSVFGKSCQSGAVMSDSAERPLRSTREKGTRKRTAPTTRATYRAAVPIRAAGSRRITAISVLPLSEAQDTALAEGDDRDQQGQDHRAGTAVAEVLSLSQRRVVEVDQRWARVRRVLTRAGEQVVELVERLEGVDEQQEQHRRRRRPQLRQGDVPQHLPALGAVDRGRLVQRRRNTLQAGKEQD